MGKITKEKLKQILKEKNREDLLWLLFYMKYNWKKSELIDDILSFDNLKIENGLWGYFRWDYEIE